MSHFRYWLLPVLILLVAPRAFSQRSVRDSLAGIYVSATPAGRHLIVDQGRYKAIFAADGRALTPFKYKALLPGLDGRFIARREYQVLLIDFTGNELAELASALEKIDTVHRFYRMRTHNGTVLYNADGSLSAHIPAGDGSNPDGPYLWTLENSSQQGVIDRLNRSVVPREYHNVQVGDAGIAAMKGDSVYAFDLAGRLRFQQVAQDSKLLGSGAVAVMLYGLWGVYDSSGQLLIPFTGYSLESAMRGKSIERNGKLADVRGRELSDEPVSYVEQQADGWSLIHYQLGGGPELRDPDLNVVLPKRSFGQLNFVGARFIHVFADYNDRVPKTFDRRTRSFSALQVEQHLSGDSYLIYDAGSRSRRVLSGDSILSLPRFTRLDRVKDEPYFILVREDSGMLEYLQVPERRRHRTMEEIMALQPVPEAAHGLLDTAMRLIVPMIGSEISMLGDRLFYAAGLQGNPGAIYTSKGKVIARVAAGNTVSRVQSLVRISGPAGTILIDTAGRPVYQGGESPAVLVPDPQETPERAADAFAIADDRIDYPELYDLLREPLTPLAPGLLFYDDSSGYSGLYDLRGRQLLPHAYYAVAQRIPGLHTLKKGDSLYYVNAHGRMLYGGRGFNGRNHFILENYSLLLQDGSGRWGSIDALGRPQLPFIYDSVLVAAQNDGARQYTLVQSGRYGVLDRGGRLVYPLQTWKPERWLAADHIYATDREHYRLINGQAVRVPADSVWGIARTTYYPQRSEFLIKGADRGSQAGIYSRTGRFLAPWFPGFDYRERGGGMLITEASRSRIAVIDTAGGMLLPFTRTPAAVILSDSAILLVDSGAHPSDLLLYADGKRRRRVTVRIDSASRAQLLALHRGASLGVSYGELLTFRTAKGHQGIMNSQGRVLIDREIEEIRNGPGIWRIRRGRGWAVFLPWELRYASLLDADSISLEANQDYALIRKAGKEGLFYLQSRLYLAPVYDRIYQPQTLSKGYLMARLPEGYVFLNKLGERISPVLDSINTAAPTIPTTAAFSNGEEVSLAIGTDARIIVERGMNAKIRRPGITGSFAPVVVLRGDGGYGLYSNESFRMILPAHYDAIDANEEGFAVWKYKPDKHQGMDSTLLVDARGRVLRAMKGGYNPIYDDGFWYLRGHGGSPVLTTTGREILPDGYTAHFAENGRYFLVKKDEKSGIVSDTGSWSTPLGFDEIAPDDTYTSGPRVGKIRKGGTVKVALIDRYGKQVTQAIYDDIRFDYEHIIFRRGAVKGYLNMQGQELSKPERELDEDD